MDIYIYGAGGHGRSAADIISNNKSFFPIYFVDDFIPDHTKSHYPYLRKYPGKGGLYIAIGNNSVRKELYNLYIRENLISVISSLSYISREAVTGRHLFTGNFSHIGPGTVIGDNSIINTGAIIEHEVKLGAHSHVAPRAVISGSSVIGEEVFIGTGAVIINNLSICSHAIIGAGAVVKEDITEPGTYVGVPAKKIK